MPLVLASYPAIAPCSGPLSQAFTWRGYGEQLGIPRLYGLMWEAHQASAAIPPYLEVIASLSTENVFGIAFRLV